MAAPILFIVVVWVIPVFWQRLQAAKAIPPQVEVYLLALTKWLSMHGVTEAHIRALPAVLTVLLLIWFFVGIRSLVLTEDGLYRSYFFWRTRSLSWDDVKEIRIDRTIRHLEDHRSTTRRLVLKFLPELRWLWSPTVIIDNTTYPEYPFVEAIAVRTGVAHLARRLYRKTSESGRPVKFPPHNFFCGFPGTLVLWTCAAGLIYAATLKKYWQDPILEHFPLLFYIAAAFLVIWGIDTFFFRQVGCDGKNLLIMRRSFVTRRIPIAALDINSIDVHGNSLRIYAKMRKGKRTACVYSTKNYITNRAALLCMLRSIYDFLKRQHIEALKSPTQRMKTIALDDYAAPHFRGEDEDGNTDSIVAEAIVVPATVITEKTDDQNKDASSDNDFDTDMSDDNTDADAEYKTEEVAEAPASATETPEAPPPAEPVAEQADEATPNTNEKVNEQNIKHHSSRLWQ